MCDYRRGLWRGKVSARAHTTERLPSHHRARQNTPLPSAEMPRGQSSNRVTCPVKSEHFGELFVVIEPPIEADHIAVGIGDRPVIEDCAFVRGIRLQSHAKPVSNVDSARSNCISRGWKQETLHLRLRNIDSQLS